jgi:hypothetical protein
VVGCCLVSCGVWPWEMFILETLRFSQGRKREGNGANHWIEFEGTWFEWDAQQAAEG